MDRSVAFGRPHLWLAMGVSALMLFALAYRATPARADADDPTTYTEVQFTQPVTIYVAPDPKSAVAAVTAPYTTLDNVGRVVGADNQWWVKVQAPGGTPYGYIPWSVWAATAGTYLSSYPFFFPALQPVPVAPCVWTWWGWTC